MDQMQVAMKKAEERKEQKKGTTALPNLGKVVSLDALNERAQAHAQTEEEANAFLASVPGIVKDILAVDHAVEMMTSPGKDILEAREGNLAVLKEVLNPRNENLRERSRLRAALGYISHAVSAKRPMPWLITKLEGELGVAATADKRRGPFSFEYGKDRVLLPKEYSTPVRQMVAEVFDALKEAEEALRTARRERFEEARQDFFKGVADDHKGWGFLENGKADEVYVVFVPPETFEGKDRETGKPRTITHPSSHLKVQLKDGGLIRVLEIFGNRGLSKALESVTGEGGLSLPIDPIERGENLRLPRGTYNQIRGTEKERAAHTLHRVLRSSLASWKVKKEDEEKVALAEAKVTVDRKKFTVERATGIALVRHHSFSKHGNSGEYRGPWILVERGEKGLTVLESSHEDLIRPDGPYEEKENFGGLPDVVGRFLRFAAKKDRKRMEEGTDGEDNESAPEETETATPETAPEAAPAEQTEPAPAPTAQVENPTS